MRKSQVIHVNEDYGFQLMGGRYAAPPFRRKKRNPAPVPSWTGFLIIRKGIIVIDMLDYCKEVLLFIQHSKSLLYESVISIVLSRKDTMVSMPCIP